MGFSDDGDGRPVVLVHGFPLGLDLYADQRALADEFRLIRFDLPGFGDAPPPSLHGVAAYAEAIGHAMDQAQIERATLGGLSMGGYVLFEFWRRYPERVEAMVLCDTRAEPDPEEGRRARRDGMERIRTGHRTEFLEEFMPQLLSPASRQRQDLGDRLRGMAARATDAGLVAALQAMHDRPSSIETLATITVPTLIIVGAEDQLTPPTVARAMQAQIPQSALIEIPAAGHLTPMENPAAFNLALRHFLR